MERKLLLAFLEIGVSLILGVIFYFKSSVPELGIGISIVGGLLVLNRTISNHFTSETFKNTENNIEKISKITELRSKSKISLISNIMEVYLNITELELFTIKDQIIEEALRKLTKLKNDKHSEELPTSEYYQWLIPILYRIDKGQSIKAVSCMFSTEWDDSPEEKKFIDGNLRAARNEANVERIFVMKKELLPGALKIDAIQKHTIEKRAETKLNGYFADSEKIAKTDKSLLNDIADGFIIFDSRIALIDKFYSDGNVRGVVTIEEHEIRSMLATFNRLKLLSEELSNSLVSTRLIGNSNSERK